ncbi:MAG: hypothetical protein ACRDV3_08155, partial [Acidothermaceae bacterium]
AVPSSSGRDGQVRFDQPHNGGTRLRADELHNRASVFPAAEPDGSLARRDRAAHRRRRAPIDLHQAWHVLLQRHVVVGGPAIRTGDVVRWPYGAVETAPIDDRDVAAVVARVISDDSHAGKDYVLTGPDALSQAKQVAIIGDVIGRRIRFEELSPDTFRRETANTWPAPVVDMLLDAWGATVGHPPLVTSNVADVVGAPARTFRRWVSDHADAFRR